MEFKRRLMYSERERLENIKWKGEQVSKLLMNNENEI